LALPAVRLERGPVLRASVILLALVMTASMASATVGKFISAEIFGIDYFTIARGMAQSLPDAYRSDGLPFAYPPTAKLFLWPMGLFQGMTAYAAFTGATAAAFLLACRRHLSPVELAMVPLSFAFLNVALCGQTTFLVVALMLAGLTAKDRRWAGVLFAVAAAIKPQLLVAVPIYVIATRDGAAFRWGTATISGLIVLSVAIFGIDPWLALVPTLFKYGDVIISTEGIRWVITPIGMAIREGLPLWSVAIPCILGAAALPFLKYADPIEALFGLTLAALLILPFGMPYEALGLVPLLARRIARGGIPEALPFSMYFPGVAILASFATIGVIYMRGGRRGRLVRTDKRESGDAVEADDRAVHKAAGRRENINLVDC
jgi:hypothetical protein